ncbi:unnamed protein product [Urochloa humidicola]
MARESHSSASNREGADAIPLIWCSDCARAKVLRRTSRRQWSYGRIFYCCPFYKQDGTGCPFWYWEEDYVKKIETIPIDGMGVGANSRMVMGGASKIAAEASRMAAEAEASRMAAETSTMVMGAEQVSKLIRVGNEAVSLLKGLLFVGVCMLIVMVLDLLVHLIR